MYLQPEVECFLIAALHLFLKSDFIAQKSHDESSHGVCNLADLF